jgi:hypothetical protein
MRGAQGDGCVALLRIVRAIATDACNAFVTRDLAEKRWHDRCIADTVVGHFHGTNLELESVDPEMRLRPSILIPVLSISRCKPVVVGAAPMATYSVFCRRLAIL